MQLCSRVRNIIRTLIEKISPSLSLLPFLLIWAGFHPHTATKTLGAFHAIFGRTQSFIELTLEKR